MRRSLRRLLEPSRRRVRFPRTVLGASLWDFGEDVLAERALTLSDDELRDVQTIAGHYEDPAHPLPVDEGRRITHAHVMALAYVTYVEGEVRPLARSRRRAQKGRPERFDFRPDEDGF